MARKNVGRLLLVLSFVALLPQDMRAPTDETIWAIRWTLVGIAALLLCVCIAGCRTSCRQRRVRAINPAENGPDEIGVVGPVACCELCICCDGGC